MQTLNKGINKMSSDNKSGEVCNADQYCDTLHKRSQHNRLEESTFVNRKTGAVSRRLFVHKLSAKDNGLVLNFCPWCGFDFSKRKDWIGGKP